MGMPAATITSQTVHGGVVMVGFPQVLINFMPASRIGDMHVCPMVTVLVPHVGGPFVMGSPTVLVGMMPQSRVTDQLVCVGPPDICVMGAETVLVGMAGAGGAGGAMGGIAAAGVSVPTQAAGTAAGTETAEMLGDGTLKYSAPPDLGLPPYTHAAPGFPDLPAKEAPNFQTAQPVNIPPGTTLYRVVNSQASAAGSYWTPDMPATEQEWRDTCAVLSSWGNKGMQVATAVVPPSGLQGWAGTAAKQEELPGGGTQLWIPAGNLQPNAIFKTAWAAASEQAQAADQALQTAQAAANQAQQAAARGADAAAQAIESAQQQAQQAAQQAVQNAQQAAQEALQQSQQAQQAAQKAAQSAQQAAQQAAAQGQAAAKTAAAEAQQQAQQAQNLSQQAQQSAQQAQQSAQQAEQGVQQALQKGGL
jgi:flagellar biosynthesis GTPase FlhF